MDDGSMSSTPSFQLTTATIDICLGSMAAQRGHRPLHSRMLHRDATTHGHGHHQQWYSTTGCALKRLNQPPHIPDMIANKINVEAQPGGTCAGGVWPVLTPVAG